MSDYSHLALARLQMNERIEQRQRSQRPGRRRRRSGRHSLASGLHRLADRLEGDPLGVDPGEDVTI